MYVDYNPCHGDTRFIKHSAKGSTWKKHKYVKVLEGVYFYPNNYKGGRHIGQAAEAAVKLAAAATGKKLNEKTAEGKKGESATEKDGKKLSSKKIDKLAQKVISGKYGNGQERMDKLGKKYAKVQNRVNQILLGDAAAKRIYDRKKAASKASSSSSSKKTSTKKKSSSSKKTSTKKK